MAGVTKRGRQQSVPLIWTASGFLALISLTFGLTPIRSDADQGSASVERRLWAMGTRLSVNVEARDRDTAVNASEAALRAVAEVEERLSTWWDDSELSRLNGTDPGSKSQISGELEADLRVATHWWRETGGAFDPGIASLMAAWDVRGSGRQPSAVELTSARAAAGLEHLSLGSRVARINTAGFGIEEGGFGKGVALRQASDAAREEGADCVVLDFGGQVAIHGNCRELRVEIADPDRRDHRIATLNIRSGSVATSGNSERGLVVDGEFRGHLLDPQSGYPAPDWGAVTVVASDPVAVDCLSTALYIMGPRAGATWLQGRPEIEAVFIERSGEDKKMTATPGLKGRLDDSVGILTYLEQEQTRTKELTK
jgi:thiamine biosynthesis lipoprotein